MENFTLAATQEWVKRCTDGFALLKNDLNDLTSANGMNYSKYVGSSYNVEVPNTGLHLQMKLDQTELCETDDIREGAGFMFTIHKKENFGNFVFNKFHFLTPGYDNLVSWQKIKYDRKTEHLEKCSTTFKVDMTPNVTEYLPDMCLFQCLVETVLKMCGCVIFQAAPYLDFLTEKFRSQGKLEPCTSVEKLNCEVDVYRKFVTNGVTYVETMCRKCPTPCYDEEYKIQMSTLLKRQRISRRSLINNVNNNQGERDLFFTVSFELATMNVEVVEESQVYYY